MILLYLALGGALGTVARYGAGSFVSSWTGTSFPWATFAINVVGSFLLGVIVALADRAIISPELRTFLAVGFCGAFTTFSTFSLEALALIQGGRRGGRDLLDGERADRAVRRCGGDPARRVRPGQEVGEPVVD